MWHTRGVRLDVVHIEKDKSSFISKHHMNSSIPKKILFAFAHAIFVQVTSVQEAISLKPLIGAKTNFEC